MLQNMVKLNDFANLKGVTIQAKKVFYLVKIQLKLFNMGKKLKCCFAWPQD